MADVYLSRLVLDPRVRAVRRGLADCAQLHRTVMSAFPDLERDKEHSNIGFIVGDQIFDYARSLGATLHGYGQAWALTHFLMEKHFDKLMAFYRRLGELPPDTFLSQEVVNQIFDDVLATDRQVLDYQWRGYMNSLKTDLELILESSK